MKLTARLPTQAPRLRVLIEKHSSCMALEVQARSVEFGKMFKYDTMRVQWMDRMPALNPDPVSDSKPIINGAEGGGGDLLDLSGPESNEPELVVPPLNALDDLLGGLDVAPVKPPGSGGGGALLDLLGDSPAKPPSVTPLSFPSPLAPMQIYRHSGSGVHIMFYFNKGPSAGEGVATEVTAVFVNPTSSPVTAFNLQAAVPKYLVLKMEPASAAVLQPLSGNVVQKLSVTNSLHGSKPIIMRVKVGFAVQLEGGVEALRVDEQAEVNFPALP